MPPPIRPRRVRQWRGLLPVAVIAAAGATPGMSQEPEPQVVSLGPAAPIAQQLAHLETNWPRQHAVGVVEARDAPDCGSDGGVTYCWLGVRVVEAILVRWLDRDPPGPGADFRLHYWFEGNAHGLPVQAGDRLVAFWIPARAHGVFVATVLRRSSREVADSVRRAAASMVP